MRADGRGVTSPSPQVVRVVEAQRLLVVERQLAIANLSLPFQFRDPAPQGHRVELGGQPTAALGFDTEPIPGRRLSGCRVDARGVHAYSDDAL